MTWPLTPAQSWALIACIFFATAVFVFAFNRAAARCSRMEERMRRVQYRKDVDALAARAAIAARWEEERRKRVAYRKDVDALDALAARAAITARWEDD